ncbi:MAG: type II toxin-antitoxin system Phd/YefM family antitoxin [Microcystaceae cyanobacterium]
MSEITTRDVKDNIKTLVNLVAESHEPITITGEKHTAILISQQNWLAIQETLYLFLLSIPDMRESIKEGLATSIEDCIQELDW